MEELTKCRLNEMYAETLEELRNCREDEARTKLYLMRLSELGKQIEISEKLEIENERKTNEFDNRTAEIKEKRKSRWWDSGIKIAGLIGGGALTAALANASLEFEKDGVHHSKTLQWVSSCVKFLPGMKG